MLVKSALSPDAAEYNLAPDLKSTRTLLHAISKLADSQESFGATTIPDADMDDVYPGAHVEAGMESIIGEDAVRHWPRTSTLKRCQLLRQVGQEMVKIANEVANDPSPATMAKALAKSKLDTLGRSPQDYIQDEFGTKAVAKYLHSSENVGQEMYEAAIIMTLVWGAADLLL